MVSEMYRFRLRFDVSEGRRLDIEEDEFVLHEDPDQLVWLRVVGTGRAIRDANALILLGSAYRTEDAARAAGTHWRGVLERTFAVLGVAADFGDYAPKGGGLASALLDDLAKQTGTLAVNEAHGLMVLPDDPTAVVVATSARVRANTPREHFQTALVEAAKSPTVTPRERLAFDIYSAAGFVSESPTARLVLLMMALEALIEVGERDSTTSEHIERLLLLTDQADLEVADKQSLKGALHGLKREPIRAAGRRLASTLGQRTYGGMQPVEFFQKCYSMRSALVHGATGRPPRDDVSRTAAQIEVFVGHLIAGRPLLDSVFPETDATPEAPTEGGRPGRLRAGGPFVA